MEMCLFVSLWKFKKYVIIFCVYRIQILYFKRMFALLSDAVEMRQQAKLCPLWGNWTVLEWVIGIKGHDQ